MNDVVRRGQRVKVKVLGITGSKMSLSMKVCTQSFSYGVELVGVCRLFSISKMVCVFFPSFHRLANSILQPTFPGFH